MSTDTTLPPGYELREMSWNEFQPLWKPLVTRLFDERHLFFDLQPMLNDGQKAKIKELFKRLEGKLEICLGIFHGGEMVAWSYGWQETGNSFYMQNSAVLPEHRRRGLYSFLVREVLRRAVDAGFMRINSNHLISNNPILIAKLKLGFHLVGTDVSPSMGLFARLAYFPTEIQQKLLDFRSGLARPDAELKKGFKLE